MQSLSDARKEAALEISAQVARWNPNVSPCFIATHVLNLQKVAFSLQKRYAAACSYEWANTETYEKRTESLERKAALIAAELDLPLKFQHDPRGWPVIITINGAEYHLA